MPTPESENRRGQRHQEPPDGVLWYERDHAVWCARLTLCLAFFDRRGLPPSMESFSEQRWVADEQQLENQVQFRRQE